MFKKNFRSAPNQKIPQNAQNYQYGPRGPFAAYIIVFPCGMEAIVIVFPCGTAYYFY
jgi:hypothetical protein